MVRLENVLEFILILKSLEIDGDKSDILNSMYSKIECLDVDLLVEYIEKKDIEIGAKDKIVELINTYYDLIDDQINKYVDVKAEKYINQLREKASIIFENYYASLMNLIKDS